jgi:hypothetical protein
MKPNLSSNAKLPPSTSVHEFARWDKKELSQERNPNNLTGFNNFGFGMLGISPPLRRLDPEEVG